MRWYDDKDKRMSPTDEIGGLTLKRGRNNVEVHAQDKPIIS